MKYTVNDFVNYVLNHEEIEIEPEYYKAFLNKDINKAIELTIRADSDISLREAFERCAEAFFVVGYHYHDFIQKRELEKSLNAALMPRQKKDVRLPNFNKERLKND